MTAPARALAVRRMGTVPYGDALRLQEDLVGRRRAGKIPDTLILLQHPHVITMGSSATDAHVLVGAEELERLGIELFQVGRGGDVTYHGPGQVVGYPILDLKPDRKDLHAYLRALEGVLIGTAAAFGVRAERREGATGVWTDRGKLAAIGVRVSSGWITSHGVALNVSADLRYFDSIVPCGLEGAGVTSLEAEVGRRLDVGEVVDAFASHFADAFGARILVV